MRTYKQVPGVPLGVVARLGGATKQAVAKAESPRRWLDYRMRVALLPPPSEGQGPATVRAYAVQAVKALVAQHRTFLEALREQAPSGRACRPAKLTLKGFRAFLGVPPAPPSGEDSFLRAFASYLKGLLDRLFEVLRTLTTGLPGEEWLPLTPRVGCPLVEAP